MTTHRPICGDDEDCDECYGRYCRRDPNETAAAYYCGDDSLEQPERRRDPVATHIVSYEENSDGTRSRAKCTCGAASTWKRGGAHETHRDLDSWAEGHVEQVTS
jgi:hypothetical protein